mmetsp:Transcript_49067/g.137381  ORF Transcript_49067/g.137381 Transcript_49067/m.137381 type:complete len:240 (-) Transcript_49067:1024-1743(-)
MQGRLGCIGQWVDFGSLRQQRGQDTIIPKRCCVVQRCVTFAIRSRRAGPLLLQKINHSNRGRQVYGEQAALCYRIDVSAPIQQDLGSLGVPPERSRVQRRPAVRAALSVDVGALQAKRLQQACASIQSQTIKSVVVQIQRAPSGQSILVQSPRCGTGDELWLGDQKAVEDVLDAGLTHLAPDNAKLGMTVAMLGKAPLAFRCQESQLTKCRRHCLRPARPRDADPPGPPRTNLCAAPTS